MRRRCLAPLLLAPALALSGCGGGLYLGFGSGGFDEPPTVTLVASVADAVPGETIRLAAAASDDRRVERVIFFRIEADGRALQLGIDPLPPYEWVTAVPAGASGSVRYFARAVDDGGLSRDSDPVTVRLP